jgi:hypothetical protein
MADQDVTQEAGEWWEERALMGMKLVHESDDEKVELHF